jgi:hypothetical protein
LEEMARRVRAKSRHTHLCARPDTRT